MTIDYTFDRPDGLTDRQWERLTDKALDVVRSVTPYKTGTLCKGWVIADLMGDQVRLKNDTPYGVYVNDYRNITGRAENILTMMALKGR